MSIIRVGLAETKHFAEGYDAIFGTKKSAEAQESDETPAKDKAPKAKARAKAPAKKSKNK